MVAFVSDRDVNLELYTVGLDGEGLQRLTTSTVGEFQPDWSPDGSRLMFAASPSGSERGPWAILDMRADGTGRQVLVESAGYVAPHPRYSPDGERIVFVSEHAGQGELYVAGADGAGARRLTHNTVQDQDPSWSPDGQRIVYASMVGERFQLFEMNADGSDVHQLSSGLAHHTSPQYSPDGRSIVYNLNYAGGDQWVLGSIQVLDLEDRSVRQITAWGQTSHDVRWTADGEGIVFSQPSPEDGGTDLYFVASNGTQLRRLTRAKGDDGWPAVSPSR